MSLIEKMEAGRTGNMRKNMETSETDSKILQPAELMRILNEILEVKCANKKTVGLVRIPAPNSRCWMAVSRASWHRNT